MSKEAAAEEEEDEVCKKERERTKVNSSLILCKALGARLYVLCECVCVCVCLQVLGTYVHACVWLLSMSKSSVKPDFCQRKHVF